MTKWIILAAIVAGLKCAGRQTQPEQAPRFCPTEAHCATMCWGSEQDNPWDCYDDCLADDDECIENKEI